MAKQKEIVIRSVERLVGITAAAKRLGCSRPHLSMVVRGLRQSRRTAELMRRNHIRVEGV